MHLIALKQGVHLTINIWSTCNFELCVITQMEANELIIFCHINLSVHVRLIEYCVRTINYLSLPKMAFTNRKYWIVNGGGSYFRVFNLQRNCWTTRESGKNEKRCFLYWLPVLRDGVARSNVSSITNIQCVPKMNFLLIK